MKKFHCVWCVYCFIVSAGLLLYSCGGGGGGGGGSTSSANPTSERNTNTVSEETTGTSGTSVGSSTPTITEEKKQEEIAIKTFNWLTGIFSGEGIKTETITADTTTKISNEAKAKIKEITGCSFSELSKTVLLSLDSATKTKVQNIARTACAKVILGYFKNGSAGKNLDSTGTNYGIKIRELINIAMFIDDPTTNCCDWVIVKAENGFDFYCTSENVTATYAPKTRIATYKCSYSEKNSVMGDVIKGTAEIYEGTMPSTAIKYIKIDFNTFKDSTES